MKKTAGGTSGKSSKVAAQKKKGVGISKPKPAKKTSAARLQKKLSSGLIAKTEKLLGERAGHLELIGKGRKGVDKSEKQKGGSRKFG